MTRIRVVGGAGFVCGNSFYAPPITPILKAIHVNFACRNTDYAKSIAVFHLWYTPYIVVNPLYQCNL
jgi:hypothetical protein